MSVLSVNKNSFAQEVINSDKTVIVDFWATWCGPCRMLSPIVDEVAKEHPEVKVCKVNVDDEPELAQHFGIMSIPTLIVFKGGKAVVSSVGLRPKSEIEAMIK